MSKRAFLSVFQLTWQRAFTLENIASGFKKTGIFPYNPQIILDKSIKKESIQVFDLPKTLVTFRIIRRIYRAYKFKFVEFLLSKILRVNERLAAEHSIDQYLIRGLTEALKHEKKRRRRGKRLNLLGQEESGPYVMTLGHTQLTHGGTVPVV